ncbi:prolyl oligopeptidase family serine peptidase [Roseateles toxinivorans]|uniref:Dipeptidyl aminopeptidase/acylaminoacyl peptidase n=1 Tax=Roseateles toxinivorans TaxID=270368 RepID=A0A4R6QK32_9BURK|nr:prolyl oligopeptidase family serine peptidase [Roseateles toxinivorans]TDP63930.1 dipeptidyl aminopeptidase/acylaminoacyl peptidase [Roseateles toxinivorans]
MILNRTLAALAFGALAVLGNSQAASAPISAAALKPQDLTLEQLYRAKPYRGVDAKGMDFSHDGRYLAYLWNPFGEAGTDLYIHDSLTGQTRRITSLAVMQAYDAPEDVARFRRKAEQREREYAQTQARMQDQAAYLAGAKVDLGAWEREALEQAKREFLDKKARDEAQKRLEAERLGDEPKKEADKTDADKARDKDKSADKELWEWRDELKKKLARDKLKPTDTYPGVEAVQWANKAPELIFQYRGDLFRVQAASGAIERLTQTDRPERIVAYTPDDSGYVFMDETRVLRAVFAQGGVTQLSRELIHADDAERKYRIERSVLTEDQRFIALIARAPLSVGDKIPAPPPPKVRQVEIMNYGERFATAKKVDREVSDDKRLQQPLALFIRKVGAANAAQPEPVFSHPGGDVWFEMSALSWAKDGSRYTFATWEREKQRLRIYVGLADEAAVPELVLERKGEGKTGHEVVNVIAPRFTPDGKTMIAVLDDEGYRQPYVIDTAARTARALLKGEFEAHGLIGFTPDSRHVLLAANRDDPAAMNLYRVDLSNGAMQALGRAGDYHRQPRASDDGRKLAAVAGNWAQRPELKLIDAASPQPATRTLTDSHDKAWAQVDLLRPERFSFRNRHGDLVQGYVFKPPGWRASDRRPAIVYLYGGPLNDRHTVEVDSFQSTAYLFGMYMAARHGFVTVAFDPRGQSNYGRRFSAANWEQPGQAQTEDLQDLVKHLGQGWGVDTQRLGLTGWSFGGFQTQYTMYTDPDLFAAGAAGAGPTEWENYNSWYSGRTLGKTERSKTTLKRFSLLPMAKGLRKPLLLVHGMQDPNVLYQDTVNVYRALLESGKEGLVELFLDPDGEHGLDGAVNRKALHKRYERFFLQHLGRVGGRP